MVKLAVAISFRSIRLAPGSIPGRCNTSFNVIDYLFRCLTELYCCFFVGVAVGRQGGVEISEDGAALAGKLILPRDEACAQPQGSWLAGALVHATTTWVFNSSEIISRICYLQNCELWLGLFTTLFEVYAFNASIRSLQKADSLWQMAMGVYLYRSPGDAKPRVPNSASIRKRKLEYRCTKMDITCSDHRVNALLIPMSKSVVTETPQTYFYHVSQSRLHRESCIPHLPPYLTTMFLATPQPQLIKTLLDRQSRTVVVTSLNWRLQEDGIS